MIEDKILKPASVLYSTLLHCSNMWWTFLFIYLFIFSWTASSPSVCGHHDVLSARSWSGLLLSGLHTEPAQGFARTALGLVRSVSHSLLTLSVRITFVCVCSCLPMITNHYPLQEMSRDFGVSEVWVYKDNFVLFYFLTPNYYLLVGITTKTLLYYLPLKIICCRDGWGSCQEWSGWSRRTRTHTWREWCSYRGRRPPPPTPVQPSPSQATIQEGKVLEVPKLTRKRLKVYRNFASRRENLRNSQTN